jgi:hypothetical protein
MLEKADTGDLLLFSGSRLGCKLQRFFTRSRFGTFLRISIDHVGMLLRYQDKRLFILEATNNEGVEVFEWNDIVAKEYNAVYNKIVYRRLLYKRTQQDIAKLENFLKVHFS